VCISEVDYYESLQSTRGFFKNFILLPCKTNIFLIIKSSEIILRITRNDGNVIKSREGRFSIANAAKRDERKRRCELKSNDSEECERNAAEAEREDVGRR